MMITGYKLFRKNKDGSLSSIFINKTEQLELNKWYISEFYPTKGYGERKGFHALSSRSAPHLSKNKRVWCRVSLLGVTEIQRPESQGGKWYLANRLRIDKILED